ncbi:hypothetical protein OGAPHI_001711 [Ogataea philodendri]|uniref:Uncharacterized protein n=1 Tax=Ogataea philodendri TaxID=1378263 RepID=A0A9P8P9V1_9ASCO|nr:uncharacterized protein OGAPHI_001711 [Ogataea philodendri]KAH3667957.1 hypothetical protein OGAPHI_001711 [Ogataea philodendri]
MVEGRSVLRHSVIPNSRGTQTRLRRSPLEPDLNVSVLLVNIKQVVEDKVRLHRRQTNNSLGHSSVNVQRFPSGSRVSSHQRMNSLDLLWTSKWVLSVEVSVSRNKDCLLTVEELLELLGKLVVSSVSRRPQGVTTSLWNSIQVQVSNTSWTLLVDQVGVPDLGTSDRVLDCVPVSEVVVLESKTSSKRLLEVVLPDDRDTRQTVNLGSLWVLLNTSPVVTKLTLLLWRQLLVSEEDNDSLCNQQSQLVLLLIGQVLKL